MNIKKISMVLFIAGVLIAVFSGSFQVLDDMKMIRIIVLIFLGVVVGILNVSEEQERDFLLASVVFVVCSQAVISLMQKLNLLSNLGVMLTNLVIFIAPAAIIISLKTIFVFASESDVNFKLDMPKSKEKNVLEEIWNFLLLLSVAIVFIILILESFFDVADYQTYLDSADVIITIIFVIDLLILFRKSVTFKSFIRRNWIDIIAVIPLGSVFRLAKVVRAVRIIKILSRTSKITRASKIIKTNRFLKFFSSDSGFNKYVVDDKKQKKAQKKKRKKK